MYDNFKIVYYNFITKWMRLMLKYANTILNYIPNCHEQNII